MKVLTEKETGELILKDREKIIQNIQFNMRDLYSVVTNIDLSDKDHANLKQMYSNLERACNKALLEDIETTL